MAAYIQSGGAELPSDIILEFADLFGAIARLGFTFSIEEKADAPAPTTAE